MSRIARFDPGTEWAEIAVVLLGDGGMRAINERFLGRDRSTDVISFRYEPMPPEKTRCSGEVFVNVAEAVRAGPTFRGRERELALYIAHGCHHLTGADDRTPVERRRMRRRELNWLRQADRDGCLGDIFTARN